LWSGNRGVGVLRAGEGGSRRGSPFVAESICGEPRLSQSPATILRPARCLWCGRPGGTCRRDARTTNLLAVGFFQELIELPRHEVEAFLQAFDAALEVGNVVARLPGVGFFCLVA
jgi:hypothetical protein